MANNTRKKHAREQVESSFKNVDSSSAYATMRKVSLSTLATVLTAATCLGGQPILASSNILLPPTTAAFAQEVRNADPTPWLHTPNILEFQRYRFANSNGKIGQIESDGLGDYDNTTKKSDMYAHLEKNGNDQYLIFDVFFNNDGKDMTGASKQQQYVWQIPFAVADLNNGYYNGDTLSDLSFDFYKRNGTSPQTTNAVLSRDFSLFTKENSQSKNLNNPLQDDQHLGNSLYKITLGIRGGNSNKQDLSDTFHNNAGDGVISNATQLRGVYSGKSYGIGLRTTNVDYAVHMHCKVKLRQGVTLDDIQDAYTWANTSTYGRTTNSAYTFISGRERWKEPNLKRTKSDNLPPKLYFNGKEISDSNNSITVYQGDTPTIKFGTSDDSGKVTKFSVSGLPDFAKNGNVDEKNDNGIDASESNPHTKVINKTTFIHKDKSGNPVNSDYTITVSATDTSGNKAEKQVKIKLENLNKKYKEPTATPITVDWGHALTENDLKPHVTGIEGGGKLVFNPFPQTNIPQEYFNGRETLPTNASAKVVYSDNSYHVVTIPVNIKKPLSLQHKLNGNTVNATVGDKLTKTKDGNKVDAKQYLGITDKNVKDKIKSAEWVNGEPSTNVAGKKTYTAKVTFSDGSTAEEKVTFTVRPKKPTIETDLTGVAGVKGKEVVVDAGPGTAGSTVTLKDSKGNQIGTGKVGNDGKVTITVANGIPEGNITAVTTTADSVSSDASDAKKATKDDKAPTLTADKDSVTVKVGEDLKIQLTAKDDVKIESINAATATMAFARNDLSKMMVVAARAKTDYTTNTDKEKVFTYTFSGFKPEEVGTYTLTFSATDAAGHKTEKTVTVKVEKKEDIKPRNITVDLGHKLDEKDAKKAIANHRSLPKGTKFAWSKETNGTPDTSTVGKEKSGKVIVTIPTNDKNHPRVETVDVKVTVRDNESPKVAIQQKGDGGTYNTINGTHLSGPKDAPVFIINTYRGDKNDIKITATDNSGEVTTLTLTPKTPGETEKAPTGTGTTADPKTLTLDGTTPLNTKPGEYTRTITAVDPSGNTNKVTVKFIVKPQSDKYSKVTGTPVTYNMSDGTKHPDPKSGIDLEAVKKLPKDAKYSWAKEPDWNKPGKDTTATVRITFPDGSTKDVETKVTVKDNIAPVIENPATNQVKHDDKQMYYQFKVHKDKPFDIEIKSYDNSGKISSATISTFPGYDGKITVDNQNGNSAEKPATIHIKGTGKRDPKLTNSSDNKWSRDLIVKDEAGNTSKLKVQISVYTDAEEHNAAPNATPKNPDQNAITNAIIITKKDDPKKTPIDKKDLTFTVGNIPQDDGVHTVPVTITYPDHSTTIVNVPVLIHKDAKDYDPKGQTVEVPWNTKPEELTKKIKSFGSGNGLKWNGTSGKDKLKSVEIVNAKDVPSTDKPGERQVQVKVTYKDGSSDVATVTVKVLKPQSETYKPEGQTINIDYNKTPNTGISSKITGVGKDKGISFGKEQGKDITLPEGASIAIDDKAKTVPDGTQPGTFDIPVTITYKDGSKDHATVKVTVGKPQSETHTPKVDGGITKKYGESGPSDNDIIAKVTVPNKPNGTTITVDKGQTPIDTKTPGTVNVKVTVKYPDGSEDHVEVPVTVGNPDNETYKPGAEAINKKRNDPAPTAEDIKNAVKTSTVDGKTPDKSKTKVELVDPKTPLPTTDKTGTTNVPVKVTYPDGSSTVVQVPVVVTDTDATANTPAVDPVEEPYGTDKEKTKKAVTAAVTVPDFKPKKDGDKPTVTITSADKDIPDGTKPGTYHVKVKVTYPDNTTDEVTVDVTIKNKQSDTFEPKATPVVKPFGKKVTSDGCNRQCNCS